jgi:hypothetical protein
MGVYKKFEKDDIYFTTVSSRPRVSVNYGVNGWSGNTGISASLSLYSGIRARIDVRNQDFANSGLSIYPLDVKDTHSIDRVIFVSGSYPATGSINYVRVDDRPHGSDSITQTQWYEEHARPIKLLYDYYKNIDSIYFTGSYDFYSALLLAEATSSFYRGPYFVFSGALSGALQISNSSSWSVDAWVKPIPTSGSTSLPFPNNPTIFSQRGVWNVFLNANGTVGIGLEPETLASSSLSVNPGEWNHIAVTFASGSASYYVNAALSNTVAASSSWETGSYDAALVVGAYESSTDSRYNLNGFIFETRVWSKTLTTSEITSLVSGTLIASASSDLVHYARFNDGPLGTNHGFSMGSGAFDHSTQQKHGYMVPFSFAHTNHWQPNDHPTFVPELTVSGNMNHCRVIHVPSMFYGKQINPGSVVISDGTYNGQNIVRILNDDGRGSLYVSGSMTRTISEEEYTGERRRKVGNVFYSEGLIVLTDPTLFDTFDSNSFFWNQTAAEFSGAFGPLLGVDFKGETKIHTKMFNCRMASGHYNASNNPTFSRTDPDASETNGDDRVVVRDVDQPTYVTSIGIYNEDRQLVAVAKLAQPIRKREKDSLNIRVKLDLG